MFTSWICTAIDEKTNIKVSASHYHHAEMNLMRRLSLKGIYEERS
jgi:hypothetical protein